MQFLSARAIAAVTATLLLSGPVLLAQDKLPLEKARTATGTITSIQKETRQFTVKGDDGSTHTFTLDERTTIKDRDKDVRLLDMGEGVKVTVTYVPNGDNLYAVTILGASKKPGDTAAMREKAKDERSKEASPVDAEPIEIKGKIQNLASDLSEVTVRTFDDKVVTLEIDQDTQTRYRNKIGAIPNLSNGSEVRVTYLVKNGRNRLVTMSDLVQPPPIPPAPSTTANSTTSPTNPGTNTVMNPGSQTNVTVQGGPPTTGGLYGGLPLIGGAVLPTGFAATSNNVAGSLNGNIAMIRNDLIIMATTPNLPPNAKTNNPNGNNGNNGGNNGNGQPAPNSNFIAQRPDLFAIVAVNSKEPFILDGSTRILRGNNQAIRWQDLREGTTIQAFFNVSSDGSKVIHTILVMDNQIGNPNQVPTNPNNLPAATDRNGNPTQPNQTTGQGRGHPPASQFPPLPNNQTGTANNANPAGTSSTTTNATNVVSGRIARLKFDSLYLQRAGNDYSFLATRNSVEPLRIDNTSRIQVNGQDGQFASLQVGMHIQVFVEFVNNARHVIGIVAGNNQNNPVVQTGRNP